MNKEEFLIKLKELNINYNDDMLDNLNTYCDILLEYNKHTNLTAIKEVNDVYLKHFYDSLTITKIIDLNTINNVLDIGSGAGFPGIVLKIFYPNINLTLIDSNNKKTKFLELIVDKLKLINTKVINDRVENFAKNNLNCFDLVTARAVTSLPVLTELSLPLVAPNKFFVAMKGNATEELNNSKHAIKEMGGLLSDVINFELLNNSFERTLIKIEKIRKTNINELRPYDKIIKKPLQKGCK